MSSDSVDSETSDNKRVTRCSSVSSIGKLPARNSGVLPPLMCIICQRDKYEKNRGGSWVKMKLMTCQGDGQKLLQRAEENKDEKILLHVRLCADLASAEVLIILSISF